MVMLRYKFNDDHSDDHDDSDNAIATKSLSFLPYMGPPGN